MGEDRFSKIVSLCKRRGFVFPSCQIYGGIGGIWDYGPLGAQLKKNIKDIWWSCYVERREDILGLDASVIMSEDVFVASGHLEGFSDILVDCKGCKKRFKIEDLEKRQDEEYLCPECGAFIHTGETPPRKFNLMLKTQLGVLEEEAKPGYLRPETAQGIFTNFLNISNTFHKKLPFGIAQIGKAFRNEVTPKSFIFRSREFEQMEIEYFVKPEEAEKWYHYWIEERFNWYIEKLGIKRENLRVRQHSQQELAHYALACSDIEFNFPFVRKGSSEKSSWQELEGIANRSDYDLSSHSRVSSQELTYFDEEEKRKYFPYVIEPSAGVDRTLFAVLCDAYFEEEVKGRLRVVLKLNRNLSPYQVAIFPLLKNKPELVEYARKIYKDLREDFRSLYDDTASIGKLYRRQDEIGTPLCVTVDVESLGDKKVTVRERDTMVQVRVSMDNLKDYLKKRFLKP